MFNTNETILAPNIVVKPIARFTNLIECDKKSASLSAVFDIYLSWKDLNLVTNISNLDTVFFSKIWWALSMVEMLKLQMRLKFQVFNIFA